MTTIAAAKPYVRERRYWLRLLRAVIVALVLAIVIPPFLLGSVTILGLTHPACNPGGNPGGFSPRYEDVQFDSTNGLKEQGYFIPGSNRATILIAPAYSGGRGAELDVAKVFNDAGFNVMTFNSRACTSHGWISLGYQEVEDVQAAYRYLQSRPDVDATRVGLHGFSSAGATVIMAAARMPEVRSISAEGGYDDYPTTLGVGQGGDIFIQLYQLGALSAYRLVTGDEMYVLSPISVIDKIAPRPLLLVYGSLEVSLPGARAMLERATTVGVNAELWVVEGADHGDYLAVAHDEFVRRLVAFHEAALLVAQNS
jgi:fermentation-respiration switch protein FrsA (DUF1100 family)